jgi:hypothetical protein
MTAARECGACSLCCTVLRVDELRKLGGTPCEHQCAAAAAESTRSGRASAAPIAASGSAGGLRDADRPDALGAVLDVVSQGASTWLEIREAQPGAFERSPRLREIAQEYRASMPCGSATPPTCSIPSGDSACSCRAARSAWWKASGPRSCGPGARHEPAATAALERWMRRLSLAIRRRRVANYRGAR